ncbi:hypothetical protein KBD61_04585 [Patescibacteria group bacterium]|nr:hypothetical protein [Patescibacteria group bacterium]MBP9710269.1 hypothetical protein [Patescibacteria group bacterium]
MLDASLSWSRVRILAVLGLGLGFFPVTVLAAEPLMLPAAQVGIPYRGTVPGAAGQDEPYHWEVSTSTLSPILPPGLTGSVVQNRHLVLRGVPTEAGRWQFMALPFSASGTQVNDGFLVTMDVQSASPVPVIVPAVGSRAGTVGVAFSSEPVVGVAGGVAPYRWTMIGGGLPTGLRFTSQGIIEGVPTVSGQYVFQAEVSDVNDMRAVASVMISVTESSVPCGCSPGGSGMVASVPFAVPSSLSVSDRQAVLARVGVAANTVVQTTELDPLMQRPTLYYIGTDARRHPFQDEQTYQSWYAAAPANVRSLSRAMLSEIPFGDAVTYRPGERVKFQTGTDTYVVTAPKTLRTVTNEVASALSWEQEVKELDQACRGAYRVLSEPVMSSYDPGMTRMQYAAPSAVLGAL